MTICRTLADIDAAALADHDGPLTQDQADLVAAILWACRALLQAPRSAVSAPLAPAAQEPPAMLPTVEEAAQELRIGRGRLYELLKCGELASVKIGSRRRIRRADLAAYVDAL
jgi:excisionase family DNA binding protein